MLDTQTKKRIDDCRDILVGKLPDPKAQIEQITIGLIYKFMDDMDKEAIDLGGSAKFFSGAYEKYAWDKLFDTKVTAAEMLRLYSDAIESMEKNPNIPQLFRDIFNNAYLPYRDPETLKLFLKTIGEFEYTHSEKLGDAFEYLLSVMGSQGDAGQFRTPRHIIDFLVAIIDPDKGETILDPACGTAGFLISAYKHILLKHTKANKEGYNIFTYNQAVQTQNFASRQFNNLGDLLTPDDRKKLIQNFAGYDISPDMVRLSLVNLYLHGFSDPHINEYDTLSSEDRWNENFDVVLANPPFMSPKGGIRPHKKFTIASNRSEVLFVDYIAEHLNPKGKAGIIVPEGVIFQSGTAYKDLRKLLVENYLYAVVSLPAGVFNPYSGVKTSILLMDKALAKQRNEILFVKIDNDGYNLGAQRTAVKGSQLEEAISLTHEFVALGEIADSLIAHAVLRTEIAANGDYNLSGERYRVYETINASFPIKLLSDVVEINPVKSQVKDFPENTEVSFVPMADLNENQISFEPKVTKKLKDVFNGYMYFQDDDVLVAKVTPCFENGKAGLAKNLKNGIGFGSSEFYVLRASEALLPSFLYYLVSGNLFKEYGVPKMTGTGGLRRVPKDVIANFQIPLPPLSIQEEIVAEIEGYQKIIDGAKAVVANYKPKIDIDPDWEMVELGEVCEVNPKKSEIKDLDESIEVSFVPMADLNENQIDFTPNQIKSLSEVYKGYTYFKEDDVLLAKVTPCFENGKAGIAKGLKNGIGFGSSEYFVVRPNEKILSTWIYLNIITDTFRNGGKLNMTGTGGLQRVPPGFVKSSLIPLPDIETQRQIVAQIEKEQALVNANKQLIEIFEQKIKDRIAKVWGE
jgi:type I restriction enzyme M protein